MEKELSDDIKKIPGESNRLLVRGLIILFTVISSLYLASESAEKSTLRTQIKELKESNAKAWRHTAISDSLYNDCGKQRFEDKVATLERIQRTTEINDSIKNLIKKIK